MKLTNYTSFSTFFSSLILFVFMFLGPVSLEAQDDYSNAKISDLFKNPKKIQWVKHYKGRVDDINDVGLIIAYDGKNCKGFITYLRSKQRFKLEGNIKGSKLKLRETDSEESVTGHFEGDIKDDYSEIKAHWFNRKKTRAGVLQLELSNKEVVFPTYCGDNKWVYRYQGTIRGKDTHFILQRSSDYDVSGIFWYDGTSRSYSLKGIMTSSKKFKVAITDDFGNNLATLEGEINPTNHRITGYWSDDKIDQQRISFVKKYDLTVGCIEYQDYMTNYDVTFPKSKNLGFNQYIDRTVSEWKTACQEKAKQLKLENPYPGPDERSIAYAAGWFKVEYISDTLISGYITFNESWEEDHTDIAFTYDLTKGQPIFLHELFSLGVDYNSILKEKALRKLKYSSLYGNEAFETWLANAGFELFTIRENGIRISTVFHPLYGRQSATIPFEDISEYLNPYSPIAYLYTKHIQPQTKKRRNK